MIDNQTIKNRLILFVKNKNLSQSKFEKACNLSNGYINNIRVSIQPNTLQKIALIFPELNTGWLMTGEGEMLKSEVKKDSSVDSELKQEYDILIKKYSQLQEKYAALLEQKKATE